MVGVQHRKVPCACGREVRPLLPADDDRLVLALHFPFYDRY